MTDDDWAVGFAKSLTVFLNGAAITEPDPRGERIKDESFLLRSTRASWTWSSPSAQRYGEQWVKVLDTALSLAALADAPAASPATRSPSPAGPCRSSGVPKVGRTPVSTYRLQLQPGFGSPPPPPPRTTWLTWA